MGDPINRTARGLSAGINRDPAHHAVVAPLHLSTNYAFDGLDGRPGRDYTRSGNPTRDLLEEALADLEGGAGAVSTASGMAAVTLAVEAFVGIGGRVVAPIDCYGGTWRLLHWWAERGRLAVDFIDMTSSDARRAALPGADLVLVETPSNPLLRITDIAAVAAEKPASARLLVDNTFCSPLLQQPLQLGADLVMHSTTKFLNGHSDVLGGALVAADADDADQLHRWCNALGLPGSAFDAYLTMRGIRTLDARMRVHQANTAAVLELLASSEPVSRLFHPSLDTHPGHDLARRQQSGFGSLVSFDLAGGLDAVEAFVRDLRVVTLAESLGGTESLACHPATMTHASMPAEVQQAAGITPGLLRLSVGIEPVDSVLDDLGRALDRAGSGVDGGIV